MKPTHERLLMVLGELLKIFPDFRLGQLISYLTERAKKPASQASAAAAIYDFEDEELLAAAEEFLENRRRQLQTRNEPAA